MESPETAQGQATAPQPVAAVDPRRELASLIRALRVHLDEAEASGAWGAAAAVRHEDPAPLVARQPRTEAPAIERQRSAETAASHPTRAASARTGAADAALPSPATVSAARGGVDPEAARARLTVLAEETRACTRCGLHQGRRQAVFARGTGSSGLVFVGEGPGEEEDRQGLPFVGAAGQLLDRMIAAMELGRDDVYVCNIVKCRPPKNRKPEPDEMAACMPYLAEQLALIQPKVIVALGATAVQGLFGTTEGITRMRGQWKLYGGKIPVMPTFHPAYLLRTPTAKRDVWKDLQEVLRRMRESGASP